MTISRKVLFISLMICLLGVICLGAGVLLFGVYYETYVDISNTLVRVGILLILASVIVFLLYGIISWRRHK